MTQRAGNGKNETKHGGGRYCCAKKDARKANVRAPTRIRAGVSVEVFHAVWNGTTKEISDIQQFSAANNRLSGSLDSLRYARNLTRLDVDSNMIGDTLPQWLADQSANMTRLSVTNNYLSCALPEFTTISKNTSLGDNKLSVLRALELE